MASRGFTVTRHYLGLATAWRAEFRRGGARGRIVGVNAEMDALPGIGHGCGHNLIAMAGVGIALALRAALEKYDIPGTVVLLGTPGACQLAFLIARCSLPHRPPTTCCPALPCPLPYTHPAAEENGAGKQILLERGAYKDMDVCIMYVYGSPPSPPPPSEYHFSLCARVTPR